MSFKSYDARIIDLAPVAASQWSVWVKPENEDFPEFEPGQFCMLSLDEMLDPVLPRPYAIVEKKEGAYRFIYRVHGKFTRLLTRQWRGARMKVLGPLGRPAPRLNEKSLNVFIAGGVGYASLHPLLAQTTNSLLFYGLRRDLEKIPPYPNTKSYFSTDDGSFGFHGRVHELLQSKSNEWRKAEAFYICGPTPMMKALHQVLPAEKSFYFLEEAMGCGVGICMGCVVPTPDNPFPKRSCLEGPVFRGDQLREWMN